MVKIVYFAAVRDFIGVDEEEITLPDRVKTVNDLSSWLLQRHHQGDGETGDPAVLDTARVALDYCYAAGQDVLDGVNEIAIFPPMTGG